MAHTCWTHIVGRKLRDRKEDYAYCGHYIKNFDEVHGRRGIIGWMRNQLHRVIHPSLSLRLFTSFIGTCLWKRSLYIHLRNYQECPEIIIIMVPQLTNYGWANIDVFNVSLVAWGKDNVLSRSTQYRNIYKRNIFVNCFNGAASYFGSYFTVLKSILIYHLR